MSIPARPAFALTHAKRHTHPDGVLMHHASDNRYRDVELEEIEAILS